MSLMQGPQTLFFVLAQSSQVTLEIARPRFAASFRAFWSQVIFTTLNKAELSFCSVDGAIAVAKRLMASNDCQQAIEEVCSCKNGQLYAADRPFGIA
jgi:hypothetical protein